MRLAKVPALLFYQNITPTLRENTGKSPIFANPISPVFHFVKYKREMLEEFGVLDAIPCSSLYSMFRSRFRAVL
jgi:hypothetical protein